MNKLTIGSIGVNLDDEKQRLFEVFHIRDNDVYFKYLQPVGEITHGHCEAQEIWVLM
jgi:hypothetical protein